MIAALVPAAVATVVTRSELDAELFAEEERSLGAAVDGRRREFATGRACARRALERLGVAAAPIASGAHGEPLWPAGVVGSITHCAGLRACAVARALDVRALGIDAEPDAPLPEGVLEVIATPAERSALTALDDHPVALDRVLFSAKEAAFKAWFGLRGQRLELERIEVRIDPLAGTFAARIGADGPAALLDGRWAAAGGLVATALAVTR